MMEYDVFKEVVKEQFLNYMPDAFANHTVKVYPVMKVNETVDKLEVIGVSEAQLRFVSNAQSGMGLMKCGNVVIPFDNTIEKGTELYNLYNTNIHEKIAQQKKNSV